MHEEIAFAATWLAEHLSVCSHASSAFVSSLVPLLTARFASSWAPADPELGSAYRAITSWAGVRYKHTPDRDGGFDDRAVREACRVAALAENGEAKETDEGSGGRPVTGLELERRLPRCTLWVDPGCVAVRLEPAPTQTFQPGATFTPPAPITCLWGHLPPRVTADGHTRLLDLLSGNTEPSTSSPGSVSRRSRTQPDGWATTTHAPRAVPIIDPSSLDRDDSPLTRHAGHVPASSTCGMITSARNNAVVGPQPPPLPMSPPTFVNASLVPQPRHVSQGSVSSLLSDAGSECPSLVGGRHPARQNGALVIAHSPGSSSVSGLSLTTSSGSGSDEDELSSGSVGERSPVAVDHAGAPFAVNLRSPSVPNLPLPVLDDAEIADRKHGRLTPQQQQQQQQQDDVDRALMPPPPVPSHHRNSSSYVAGDRGGDMSRAPSRQRSDSAASISTGSPLVASEAKSRGAGMPLVVGKGNYTTHDGGNVGVLGGGVLLGRAANSGNGSTSSGPGKHRRPNDSASHMEAKVKSRHSRASSLASNTSFVTANSSTPSISPNCPTESEFTRSDSTSTLMPHGRRGAEEVEDAPEDESDLSPGMNNAGTDALDQEGVPRRRGRARGRRSRGRGAGRAARREAAAKEAQLAVAQLRHEQNGLGVSFGAQPYSAVTTMSFGAGMPRSGRAAPPPELNLSKASSPPLGFSHGVPTPGSATSFASSASGPSVGSLPVTPATPSFELPAHHPYHPVSFPDPLMGRRPFSSQGPQGALGQRQWQGCMGAEMAYPSAPSGIEYLPSPSGSDQPILVGGERRFPSLLPSSHKTHDVYRPVDIPVSLPPHLSLQGQAHVGGGGVPTTGSGATTPRCYSSLGVKGGASGRLSAFGAVVGMEGEKTPRQSSLAAF